jgi:nucleoside-diphosphate-sugar epimerase
MQAQPPNTPPDIRRVLVTGGNGRIGSYFIKHNAERYTFRMVDRAPWDEAKHGPFPGEEASVQDLADLETCRKACAGMDAVIHLAADPRPDAAFESLLPNNFITTYNMFQAAHDAGVKRMVFASSIHAIDGYPEDVLVFPDMPTWPKNMYGVSKIYGEAVGKYFAYTEGLPTVCLRIGPYVPADPNFPLTDRDRKAWTNPDDLNQLIVKCLESNIRYAVVHATAQNRAMRMDITATVRDFDYHPTLDAFDVFPPRTPAA